MRILMISQHYPPRLSGYALICADASGALRRRGHVVRVLTSVDEPTDAREDGDVRRVLRRCPVEGYQTTGLRGAFVYFDHRRIFGRNAALAAAHARDFAADLAVVWQFDSLGPDLVQALYRLGVPVVFSAADVFLSILRGLLIENPGLVWRAARSVFYRTLVRELDRSPLVLSSEALREHYLGAGFDARLMTVIPVSIDAGHIAATPPPAGPGNRLLYAGRLHPWKGIDVALRALAILNADARRRFTLDLVGDGDAPYVAELRELTRTLGLDDAVRFLGAVDRDRLMRLYDRYDMSLVPSVCHEGGPLTLVESLARGVPVVASDRGGPRSLLTHGVDGLLVEPESAEALAAGVRQLADDPQLRRAMGERGLVKVRERFSLDGHVASLEALLRRVAKGKTST
ncbi:MAG TPA: glycosyltransferase family 4 protein [Planctomycetota bacterium]|nr:glycosyltransferase family 4 protein [Planctomycetota bacterium]